MTGTATLELDRRLRVSVFSAGGATLKATTINEDGTARYEGVPVFRSGTFRDSMGMQHTYAAEHMAQLSSNFDMLRANGIFPSPPVRADHSLSVKNVVGYVDGASTGTGPLDQYTYLLANFDVTEPDAVARIERGSFRFRSAEIGYYETNDEAMYWPVLMGFAFVDIPAVEGLDQYAQSPQQHFSLYTPDKNDDKEQTVPEPAKPFEFSLKGVKTTDGSAVQARLDELEAAAAAGPPAVKFRIDGAEVEGVAAAQTHIDMLETFRSETLGAARTAFVKKLAADGKILATQIDEFESHVKELTPAQFESFTKLHADVPVNPLLNKFDKGDGKPPSSDPTAQKSQVEIDTEIVDLHRRGGMPQDQLENTPSFKRLAASNGSK